MATEVLGPEHDRRLTRAANWALRQVGARRTERAWSLLGSQEVGEQQWITSAGPLTLTSETYMGLVLDGPDEVVEKVGALVRQRLRGT
jgi:hypothetical protein